MWNDRIFQIYLSLVDHIVMKKWRKCDKLILVLFMIWKFPPCCSTQWWMKKLSLKQKTDNLNGLIRIHQRFSIPSTYRRRRLGVNINVKALKYPFTCWKTFSSQKWSHFLIFQKYSVASLKKLSQLALYFSVAHEWKWR